MRLKRAVFVLLASVLLIVAAALFLAGAVLGFADDVVEQAERFIGRQADRLLRGAA